MKDWKPWQVVMAIFGGLLIVAAVLLVQFSITETLKGVF